IERSVDLALPKWVHYAETPEARREVQESEATRISEGLETNLGVLGRAGVGSQTMGGGRNALTSRGSIRRHFCQSIERLARSRIGQACACRHGEYRPHR